MPNSPLQQRVGAVSPGNPHPGPLLQSKADPEDNLPLLLTLSKAAKFLGRSKYKVKDLAARGLIDSVIDGAQTVYTSKSICDYAAGLRPHRIMNQRKLDQSITAAARAKVLKRTAA